MITRIGRRLLVAGAAVSFVALGATTTGAEPSGSTVFEARGLTPDSTYESFKAGPDGRVNVFVQLADEPVASYDGGLRDFAPTSPRATGKEKVDAAAPEVRRYRSHLESKQAAIAAAATRAVPAAQVTGALDVAVNGLVMTLPKEEIATVAALPGVVAVLPDELLQIETYGSVPFIGAPAAWALDGGPSSAGEGVIVGVLDSGVWPESPSFSDSDPSGKPYPTPPAKWSGAACTFGAAGGPLDPDFACNNKLIGAARFMDTYDTFLGLQSYEFRSARDEDGHGTHTASTAAGNGGVRAQVLNADELITGVAPRAHLAIYKVCGELGCFGSDSAAAVDQAILDGVDVINFSISGGTSPYTDVASLAFLGAYDAGVFVAASAGNSGPGADTVNHREPWVATVAASTSNLTYKSTATVTAGGDTLVISGVSSTAGVATPTPVVRKAGDDYCLSPAPAGSLAGSIVVCTRGINARVAKSANVGAGGAAGMFLVDPAPSGASADAHSIPTVHFEFAQGKQLTDFLADPAHASATATFTDGAPAPKQGDVMAGFSSRGGPAQTLGINKPDITGPGVDILAAYTNLEYGTPVPGFAFLSGTSMSGPHVAGAGAMLKAIHPTWTPGQIKSALMTRASTAGLVKEDGVTPFTPFDAGSGRADLALAPNPGVTISASAADFEEHRNDLWNANYPSIYFPTMPGQMTVQRTLQSVTRSRTTWSTSVEAPPDVRISVPNVVQVAAFGTATFSITVDASEVPVGEVRHATIRLLADQVPGGLRIPVTLVRAQPTITMSQACTPATFPRLGTSACTVTMQNTALDPAPVTMVDSLSKSVSVVPGSVQNGAAQGNTVRFNGTLAGNTPPSVTVASGTSPGGGYLPLSSFSIQPIAGVGDETISNFNVPAFGYAGETYTRLGVVSNGYVVVGGGTAADIDFVNQALPDSNRPNNVLAPFWTDLNPAGGGALRAGTLTDGSDTWIVLEWEAVPEYSSGKKASFQVWIGVQGDANPGEDISYAYGSIEGNGDGAALTVGAENAFGSRGANYFFNGTGPLPASGTQLQVTGTPGVPAPATRVTFTITSKNPGPWWSRAELRSPVFEGVSVAVVRGAVTSG